MHFSQQKRIRVIFNTEESFAITISIDHLIETPLPLHRPLFLGGMTHGSEVTGIEQLYWTQDACDHTPKLLQIVIVFHKENQDYSSRSIFN